MTVKEIKQILNKTEYRNCDIYSYKHLNGGLMNTIWKVETSLGNLIIKIYDLKRNLNTSNKTMKLWKNFVVVPEAINSERIKYNGKNVLVYKYISGEEIAHPNYQQLQQILNIIKTTNKEFDNIKKGQKKISTVEKQYNYLKKLKSTKIDNNIVKDVMTSFEKIKEYINEKSTYYGHFDLNYGNILWDKNNLFGVIDFDEASVCTKEYELVVFATKHCMIEDEFDEYYLYEILKLYYENLTKEIIDEYKKTFKFYTIKVLMEKFYLYQKNIINIYDKRQSSDNWNWWYKLYNSVDEIMDNIIKNV